MLGPAIVGAVGAGRERETLRVGETQRREVIAGSHRPRAVQPVQQLLPRAAEVDETVGGIERQAPKQCRTSELSQRDSSDASSGIATPDANDRSRRRVEYQQASRCVERRSGWVSHPRDTE